MKVLRLVPLVLLVAACSSANLPLSPYRIDVQQGNALEQEAVEKLKPGMSRSQVRFLLGTPLLVDPFRGNRWDYVYNFRKAGRLTEQRRLALFFEGDTLARIEAEGLSLQGGSGPAAQAANAAKAAPAVTPAASSTAAEKPPADRAATTVVPPLMAEPAKPAAAAPAPAVVAASEPLALQKSSDVAALQPDVMPEFPERAPKALADGPLMAALQAWADAWRSRDEAAYFAAYAPDFRPEGKQSRSEWEKRRRLLFGVSRNVDLKIEGVTAESQGEDRAVVRFRQYYRSDTYRDAVHKQLVFVRIGDRWLIEEEKALAPIKGGE